METTLEATIAKLPPRAADLVRRGIGELRRRRQEESYEAAKRSQAATVAILAGIPAELHPFVTIGPAPPVSGLEVQVWLNLPGLAQVRGLWCYTMSAAGAEAWRQVTWPGNKHQWAVLPAPDARHTLWLHEEDLRVALALAAERGQDYHRGEPAQEKPTIRLPKRRFLGWLIGA